MKKNKRRRSYIPSDILKDWFEAVLSLDDSHFESGSTMRDYVVFVILTGVRREEARALKRSQVNLKRGTFKLIDTKNHEDVELPMSQYLFGIIKTRLSSHHSDYVFAGKNQDKPFDAFKRPIQYLKETIEFDFTIHDLRRTFATYANSIDVSHYTVKSLINHKMSESDVTEGYIIVEMEKKKAATEKITQYMLEKAGVQTIKF